MSTEEIRILKIATCPSLSGRSTLTYHVGCKADQSIQFRIVANSGTGVFSKDWVPLEPLIACDEKTMTAGTVKGLFQGKSTNTVGFCLAILKAEGIIKASETKPGTYELLDTLEHKKGIQALINEGISLNEAPLPDKGKPVKAKKETPKKPITDKASKDTK